MINKKIKLFKSIQLSYLIAWIFMLFLLMVLSAILSQTWKEFLEGVVYIFCGGSLLGVTIYILVRFTYRGYIILGEEYITVYRKGKEAFTLKVGNIVELGHRKIKKILYPLNLILLQFGFPTSDLLSIRFVDDAIREESIYKMSSIHSIKTLDPISVIKDVKELVLPLTRREILAISNCLGKELLDAYLV